MIAVSCLETKTGNKRKAQKTQNTTHHIIGEHLMTVTQGSATKLKKLIASSVQYGVNDT